MQVPLRFHERTLLLFRQYTSRILSDVLNNWPALLYTRRPDPTWFCQSQYRCSIFGQDLCLFQQIFLGHRTAF